MPPVRHGVRPGLFVHGLYPAPGGGLGAGSVAVNDYLKNELHKAVRGAVKSGVQTFTGANNRDRRMISAGFGPILTPGIYGMAEAFQEGEKLDDDDDRSKNEVKCHV